MGNVFSLQKKTIGIPVLQMIIMGELVYHSCNNDIDESVKAIRASLVILVFIVTHYKYFLT